MDIRLRRTIYRFPPVYRLCQRIVDGNNRRFYRKIHTGEQERRILRLKNSHAGERCFLVGNGPSLSMEDLERIKGEDCFAANLIFRVFDQTGWRPKYYFIQDRYADTGAALDTLDLPYLFIGDYYWRTRGVNNPRAICIHSARSLGREGVAFSEDMNKGLVSHCTITYTMIQAAVYMGYKTIYLLGMDHSYALTYDAKGNVTEAPGVKNHVFADKNPREVIANIEGINKAYLAARDYAQAHGIRIYNSTRGGRLEWFPRRALEEAFKTDAEGESDCVLSPTVPSGA